MAFLARNKITEEMQEDKAVIMLDLVGQWEKGKESRLSFCQGHNITVHSFGYWRTKYLKQQKPSDNFTELAAAIQVNKLEIHYPNGVRILIPSGSDMSMVEHLITLG
jgi:hypothetical protein